MMSRRCLDGPAAGARSQHVSSPSSRQRRRRHDDSSTDDDDEDVVTSSRVAPDCAAVVGLRRPNNCRGLSILSACLNFLQPIINYLAPGSHAKRARVSACLSVCPLACPDFTIFSIRVTSGRDSILL